MQLVAAANANRDNAAVEARSMEAAIAALTTSDEGVEDRHPERCGGCGTICTAVRLLKSCRVLVN